MGDASLCLTLLLCVMHMRLLLYLCFRARAEPASLMVLEEASVVGTEWTGILWVHK